MVKASVRTPNTGGQHWERFHVLGRVDYLIVQGLCLCLKKSYSQQIRDTQPTVMPAQLLNNIGSVS